MVAVSGARSPVADWRFKLGITLFCLSIAVPIVGLPLITSTGLSTAMATTVSGITLAAAEVLGIIAVAVMGKDGYALIKARITGLLKRYQPPAIVGRVRYTIGLCMFAAPILFGWVAPYIASNIPGYMGNEVSFAVAGDILLLTSLFVLGGDFWDKLRALFICDARAIFSETYT